MIFVPKIMMVREKHSEKSQKAEDILFNLRREARDCKPQNHHAFMDVPSAKDSKEKQIQELRRKLKFYESRFNESSEAVSMGSSLCVKKGTFNSPQLSVKHLLDSKKCRNPSPRLSMSKPLSKSASARV
uniref:Uncharacterized protein n=3 Tax=Lotharella globosa TaxID=91324 RepID=A0A7S4DN93_9EUKA